MDYKFDLREALDHLEDKIPDLENRCLYACADDHRKLYKLLKILDRDQVDVDMLLVFRG